MKKNLGFTLIELLVVVAIISLLSSVVLASVKESRDKAKASAFRQEVYQFINALELYKSDTGYYPGENYAMFIYYKEADGTSYTEIDASFSTPTLESLLNNNYLSKYPTPFIDGTNFGYLSGGYSCWGDTVMPGYIILVSSSLPGFEDWKFVDNGGEEGTTQRCFSLK